jgi:hypothetical protein
LKALEWMMAGNVKEKNYMSDLVYLCDGCHKERLEKNRKKEAQIRRQKFERSKRVSWGRNY